jgi:hypothetical protein
MNKINNNNKKQLKPRLGAGGISNLQIKAVLRKKLANCTGTATEGIVKETGTLKVKSSNLDIVHK